MDPKLGCFGSKVEAVYLFADHAHYVIHMGHGTHSSVSTGQSLLNLHAATVVGNEQCGFMHAHRAPAAANTSPHYLCS